MVVIVYFGGKECWAHCRQSTFLSFTFMLGLLSTHLMLEKWLWKRIYQPDPSEENHQVWSSWIVYIIQVVQRRHINATPKSHKNHQFSSQSPGTARWVQGQAGVVQPCTGLIWDRLDPRMPRKSVSQSDKEQTIFEDCLF